MAGINVGSVFMDAYINANGFTAGVDNIKVYSNKAFAGISSMIISEWTATKTQTDTKMSELFTSVSEGFLSIKTDAETKMGLTKGVIQNSFEVIKNNIYEKMLYAKEFVSAGLGAMKEKFSELVFFLGGDFNSAWDKAFNGIKNSFDGVWEGMSTVMKTAINGCIKMLNGFIGGIWSSIKSVVDVIGSLIRQFGSLIGFSDWGFSMPDVPQIPMLAKGGIIKQPTLAMVGERGREVVMPLENNTGWMVELANTIGSVIASNGVTQNSGGNGENVARLYVDGKQLAETIFDNITAVANRRGIDLKPVGA